MMPLQKRTLKFTSMQAITRILAVFGAVFLCSSLASAQPGEDDKVLDRIIAVIGDNVVLQSELDVQYEQYLSSGLKADDNTRCDVFESLLFQKLLLDKAVEDSIEVGEAQIQGELDRRLRYYINQIGSEEKLEAFYNKSIDEIKSEFHDIIQDQLLIQNMQSIVTSDVKVAPAEVKAYYNRIPKDSLPFINSEVEIAHIVRNPKVSDEEKERVRTRLDGLRNRVLAGEDFGTLAYLYSEDPGSASKNGELGYTPRSSLVSEFAATAFALKKGEISKIVETQFGFHIIQYIGRRGEDINVRHILLKPQVASEDLLLAKNYIDSIAELMNQHDTLTFGLAAQLYSDDEDTKNNAGKVVNPITGSTKFEMDQLGQVDPSLFLVMDKMEVGDISKAVVMQKRDGSKAYRLVQLLAATEPHRANLKDDYSRLQEMTKAEKEERQMQQWIGKQLGKSYIKINGNFATCSFEHNWPVAQE